MVRTVNKYLVGAGQTEWADVSGFATSLAVGPLAYRQLPIRIKALPIDLVGRANILFSSGDGRPQAYRKGRGKAAIDCDL